MSSTVDKLSNSIETIEEKSSRFVKSMSTTLDEWLELNKNLKLAKNLLVERFSELELKEKRFQEFHHELPSSPENTMVVHSSMVTLNKEYEKLQLQMTIQNVNHVRSQYEVGETSNRSIVPVNIVSEPKESNKKIGQRKRKSRAEVWRNYFTKIVEEDGKSKKGKCNYCSKLYHINSTPNMHHHITMGKCTVYEDIIGGNNKMLRMEPMSKKKVQIYNSSNNSDIEGFHLGNCSIKNDKILDSPPPSFQMNENHAKLLLVTKKTSEA
ncbi:hypothetical protein LIER_34189 [Lithospermum erythrorhizon]|uniref:BED-type domain-containing protein n=1 Tax=Lithospermum erythrorhizon TaxID=34254 RepID=A0AAV3S3B5_LITER